MPATDRPAEAAGTESLVSGAQDDVFAFLADPRTYGGDQEIVRIDTHGAAVFLGKEVALKVKRAVRYPFMDFSTLELRRAACEREIAVNAPNAPAIYLGVVPICRSADGLTLGGPGEVVEWAVKMQRFDESRTLDRLAAAGPLPPDLAARLARAVLASHERAPRRPAEPWIGRLRGWIADAAELLGARADLFEAERVQRVSAWLASEADRHEALLLRRGRELGAVRRLHGDLHLGNIVLIGDEPTLFDAVEFDDAIATGDVLYDLAFLLMDLSERSQDAAANEVLNRYLWGADTDAQLPGLAAMPLFLALRACIRAHVTAARARLTGEAGRRAAEGEAVRYLSWAGRLLGRPSPVLIALGGLSGSGKTTVARLAAPTIGGPPGAVHLRSDVLRKRLFGASETERLPAEAYAPHHTAEVYERLRRQARSALEAGASVVVDAVHAREHERQAIEEVARDLGRPFRGLWLHLPLAERVRRVEGRSGDASDADARVAEDQELFDTGPLGWTRLDASRSAGESANIIRALASQGEADPA